MQYTLTLLGIHNCIDVLVFYCCSVSTNLTYCVHTTVVMCGYLHYCHHPFSFDQSGPSPLTSLIKKVFLPTELLLTGCFLFLHHSLQILEAVVRENPRRSAGSEILKPPCLAPIIISWSKSLRSHLFPILTFGLKNN